MGEVLTFPEYTEENYASENQNATDVQEGTDGYW